VQIFKVPGMTVKKLARALELTPFARTDSTMRIIRRKHGGIMPANNHPVVSMGFEVTEFIRVIALASVQIQIFGTRRRIIGRIFRDFRSIIQRLQGS